MAHGQHAKALAVLVAVLTVVCVALIIALDSYHGDYLDAVGGAEDQGGNFIGFFVPKNRPNIGLKISPKCHLEMIHI